LEDLFRIYMRVPEPLDRGPFQSPRPGMLPNAPRTGPALYDPALFGNPTDRQVQEEIESKLRLKREQGNVAVLGWYIRFINDRQPVRDETRREHLRNWVRFPRVFVRDSSEFDGGKWQLQQKLRAFEQRRWTPLRSQLARESQLMNDRISVMADYSGALDGFNRTIREIISLASESILHGMRMVNMEVDFEVYPRALSHLTSSPYQNTREGANEAVGAWNALFPRQRSALVARSGDLSEALQETYEALHEMRGISVPEP